MPRTSSVRQLLVGRTLTIAALAVAGLVAPLGACMSDGAGGAQQCGATDEYASVKVTLSDGIPYTCNSMIDAASPEMTLQGVVRNDAPGKIVVDSCHPNDTCAPMESVITLSGTDLSVSIPDGTFVQVRLDMRPSQYGCMLHVIVRNLPAWSSTPNPTSDGTFLWLAYHHGFDIDISLPDDPYQTERELVCENKDTRFYALHFSFPDAPGAEVVARQGQTVTWTVPQGEHTGQYRVRNVEATFANRSEYSYWIARK